MSPSLTSRLCYYTAGALAIPSILLAAGGAFGCLGVCVWSVLGLAFPTLLGVPTDIVTMCTFYLVAGCIGLLVSSLLSSDFLLPQQSSAFEE